MGDSLLIALRKCFQILDKSDLSSRKRKEAKEKEEKKKKKSIPVVTYPLMARPPVAGT